MKKAILLFLLFAAVLPSCKKFVEQQQLNAFMKVLTNGVWVVTNYTENGNNITSSFSGYSFQFKSDGTVAGINGATTVNGTWTGDINKLTITSHFPTTAHPLDKLNAAWKVTDSYTDSVAANTFINALPMYLNLKKH